MADVTKHKEYTKNLFKWYSIRDAVEGESAIKMKNELYLPMPRAMAEYPPAPSESKYHYSPFYADDFHKQMLTTNNPNFHPNPAYMAYKTRAIFHELPGYILRGLIGLAVKKLPLIELPSELEYLRKRATKSGLSLEDYYAYVLEEVITTGRMTSVLDVCDDGEIRFAAYSAEKAFNWKLSDTEGEDEKLAAIRLLEDLDDNFDKDEVQAFGDQDYWELACMYEGEVLIAFSNEEFEPDSLPPLGQKVYVAVKYKGGTREVLEYSAPTYKGKTLDYVPAITIGSLNNTVSVDPSPLYPICVAAVHIYMKSADVSQSQFMACSPMLVMTGVSSDQAPSAIGSTVALAIPNPEAKVYYPKTDTSALSHVKGDMDDLYTQAINMGAQLLDTSPKPAETAETTRLKQAASSATLLTTIRSIASALNKQLKQIAEWTGADPDAVKFIPNTEFIPPAITAAEIRELVQSWMNGAISQDTVLENFQAAGILREGLDLEEEKQRIKDEEIVPGSPKAVRIESLKNAERGALKPQDGTPETEEEVD